MGTKVVPNQKQVSVLLMNMAYLKDKSGMRRRRGFGVEIGKAMNLKNQVDKMSI